MTNPPDTTTEALHNEIERLRAKNAELLGELKAAKATATEAQEAAAATGAELEATRAEVRSLRLDAPVASLLGDVAIDADLFGQVFARHYRFELDADGRVAILDAEGKPAMVADSAPLHTGGNARTQKPDAQQAQAKPRPAMFTAADVRKLAESSPDAEAFARLLVGSRASGGGAIGVRGATATAATAKPDATPAASPYGLR
ncbi:hypothetical protein CMZ82_12415 [Lysobacteraceae bacterium NML93-0792]|nr:hypothetical protein CMZ82_12415 [Xanthomonadaceae bacterium NML93-0792]PBS16162.1 hypothetical protein CMZ81_07535 [Xanthomonadaceae bacterium NML93-0793]PBS20188.1 hypothetical protein CMZ80_04300 [Xanthomonadaceae bacterium NML93-0831]